MANSLPPPVGADPGRPLHILVLEDEPADALAAISCLRHDGLEVEWTLVEAEADFRAALDARPDLILADVIVPGFGALDALRVLAGIEGAPPVIVFTGKLDDAAAAECLRQGAVDYLLKDRLARLPQAVRQALREAAGDEVRAEVAAALRATEERALMDFEQELVGIFVTRPDGRVLNCNTAFAGIFGHDTVDAVLGADASSLYANPERRTGFVDDVRRLGRLHLVEEELRGADGAPVHVLESVMGVFDERGDLREIRGYMVDITALKRAQSERDSLAAAMEQAAESVVITDLSGKMTYVNAAFTQLTGYTREEALGQNPRMLKSGVQNEAFYRGLWGVLVAGRTWTGRIVNRRKDGTLFTADATISPMHDASGTLTGYLSFQKDVTREVALETQLATSQKLEAVGRLAAGVAHDFNNVLTVITTGAQLGLDIAATPKEVRGDLEEMLKAARRGASLSRQLLAFGRQHALQPEVLDPNGLLREAVKMLSRVIGEDIDVALELDPAVGNVHVDPAQFQTAVMNLAINARDAMPAGGRLVVRTKPVDEAEGTPDIRDGIRPPGAAVLIEVADTGHGMDAEVRERIFEPFFTTKPEGKGNGLGLAMVYGTITQSGGTITVDSEPGAGATFKILLPVVARDPEKVADDPGRQHGHSGERVLLVEDDPSVRRGVQRALQSLGYHVEAHGHPDEALRWCQDPANRFDLLVTDLVMPGMDGASLAAAVRRDRAGIGVLFVSGYAPRRVLHDGVIPPGTSFLAKPFTRDQLAEKVLEALGRA